MDSSTTDSTLSSWRTPLMIIAAGCLIAMLGFGARSVAGLFLEPITNARGFSRETFALALAWQNLLWGIGVPIAGTFADRHGAVKVLVVGALLYAGGLYGMANASTATALYWTAGIVTGIGVAFTSFSLALAAMAKIVAPERRSFVLGLGTAAGSFGQVVFSPLSQACIANYGWHTSLYVLAASVLMIIPLALLMPGREQLSAAQTIEPFEQNLRAALLEALRHRGFVLLTMGFFVCGFHVAFIVVHFPAYVRDLGLSGEVGAWSIALLGLFNIIGSLISGYVGQRYSKRTALSCIYFLRALVITALLVAVPSAFTIYCFAVGMGLLWLSTVPLTTGIVAQVFGVRYMATLFGVVFLSHQLGSFLGVWLGGRIHDLTGSYDAMWWAGVALSIVAAILHLPIDERPLARNPVAVAR